MKKTLKLAFVLALVFSLGSNFIQWQNSKYPRLNGGISWLQSGSLRVAGYLKWTNHDQQPKNMRQFFKFEVDGKKCDVIDAIDFVSGAVVLDSIGICEVEHIDSKDRSATIRHKNLSITVKNENAVWVSGDSEFGSGTFSNGYDL